MKTQAFYKNANRSLQILVTIALLVVFGIPATKAATLLSVDFTTSGSGYSSSGWTRNSGTDYSCAAGNYCAYSSSSTNYLYLSNIHVPRGKGVKVTFTHKYYSNTGRTITVYARVGGYATFNTTNIHYNSWMQVSNAISVSSTTCTSATVDIPGNIVGGQDLCILFVASNTNACIDNIVVSDDGTAATVPNIASAPYTKTFDESTTYAYFYGPVSATGFQLHSSSNNIFSYFTNYGNNNSSGAYTRISSTGGNNGKVNSSTSGYCAYISSNSADASNKPAPSGYPCFITKELNTSTCTGTTATLRFAFRQTYSGGYTSDETYTLYCPRIFYATTSDVGTGYSWTQATINYYFPNGQWWYAATSLPKEQNLIVAFCAGTISQQYNFDDIKISCKDCEINDEVGGTISCTSNPGLTEYQVNTEYTFTIGATTFATYYKWIVRDLTSSSIYYGTTSGTNPAIVSGQGTQNVTINFGTAGGTNYRVMCIPYDSDYGTDAAPTDACYAKISYYASLTEVEIPAPILLVSFLGSCSEGKAILSWSTASETNNEFFTIEKSSDCKNWIFVADIAGAGNSNQIIDYSYTDKHPLPGTSYYRIKQTDFDGKNLCFAPVSVNCIGELQQQDIFVYPNPADDYVIVVSQKSGTVKISLSDITGRLINNYNTEDLSIPLKISLTDLNQGVYILKIDGFENGGTFRVVKK